MSGWQQFYDSGEFSIDTDEPSGLVKEFGWRIPSGSRVADVGCGAGRNSVFLATIGHGVDASDPVDLGWHESLDKPLAYKIKFEQTTADRLRFEPNMYGGVVMMRLFQYLPHSQLEALASETSKGLTAGGFAIASYVTSGGRDKSEFGIATYDHRLDDVMELFTSEGLTPVDRRELDTVSRHVPYHAEISVAEMVLVK